MMRLLIMVLVVMLRIVFVLKHVLILIALLVVLHVIVFFVGIIKVVKPGPNEIHQHVNMEKNSTVQG
jgi:c-di-AMP phosphodiesterase-like protein